MKIDWMEVVELPRRVRKGMKRRKLSVERQRWPIGFLSNDAIGHPTINGKGVVGRLFDKGRP